MCTCNVYGQKKQEGPAIKCSNRAQQQTPPTPEPCCQPCITEKDWEGGCTAGWHVCKALGSILSTQHWGSTRLSQLVYALETGFENPTTNLPTPPQITMDACSDSFQFGREKSLTSHSIFCYFWVSWLYIYHLNIKSIPTRIQLHMVSQTHTISPYLSIYSLSRTSNTRINSTLGLSADDEITPQFWKVQVVSTAFWCQ